MKKGIFVALIAMALMVLVGCADGGGKNSARYGDRGPHRVVTDTLAGPGNVFNIYRPAALSENHAAVFWANGTGASASSYGGFLRHLASHGFIVIADRSPMSMNNGRLTRAAKWLIKQNGLAGSVFYGKVDVEAFGVSGHSQGGAAAIQYAADPVFKTSVLICPAPFESPSQMKGPSLWLTATADVIVMPGVVRNLYNNAPSPRMFANMSGGTHFSYLGSLPGSRGYITAWFSKHLRRDPDAQFMFNGIGCGMCLDRSWRIQKNGI